MRDIRHTDAPDSPMAFKNIPSRVQLDGSPSYLVEKRRLGRGGCGQVHVGTCQDGDADKIAIKFELKASSEKDMYDALAKKGVIGLPRIRFAGQLGEFYVMGMDLFDTSLLDELQRFTLLKTSMDPVQVKGYAVKAIRILESLHSSGHVHGDVKPDNFMLKSRELHIVDLGLTAPWSADAFDAQQRPDEFQGTIIYASVHALLGRPPSRRDDLESLLYSLVTLLRGKLPWHKSDIATHCVQKATTSIGQLTRGCDPAFSRFGEAVTALRFDEDPDYAALTAMFVGAQAQQAQQARKRKREPAYARGKPVWRWLAVVDREEAALAQQTRAGVSTLEIASLFRVDGFIVSAVAFDPTTKRWTVVMRAGDSAQVYHVGRDGDVIPSEWICAQWALHYNITSIAGPLVTMTAGLSYERQSFKVDVEVPSLRWITDMWKDGFRVTTLAFVRGSWVTVMSTDTDIVEQRIELGTAFPSEGVARRLAAGFRATCCASSATGLVVFVMSKFPSAAHAEQDFVFAPPSSFDGGRRRVVALAHVPTHAA